MDMKKSNMKIYLLVVLILVIGFIIGRYVLPSDHRNIESSDNQTIESSDNQVWTCSMHPQIRQNEPGKCPICGMDLIPLTQKTDKGENSPFVHTMSPEAIALANVQTQKVKVVSPEHEIHLTGKVAVNEQRLAVITANYSGRIEKLFIDFTGQTVNKGQKLATIYSPELITAQKELIEASKFKEINPALYHAAREKLRLWKIKDSQINEIENNGAVLTEFDVYADQTGVVMKRDVSKGDYVNKGNVLFAIADLSNVWIVLDAYESDLPFMKTGQTITFTLASIPGKEFKSTITFIDPLINPQTRTASVRSELANSAHLLKPEMFVKGKIKANLSVKEKSLVIPNTSLLWTGKRSIVYVKIPDTEFPAFEMREITLGASLGEYYIVESGLTEGEEIVTNGVFAIDAAAQLNGNYSMMNRASDEYMSVPDKFTTQLTTFINHYFDLKNALIEGDFQKTQSNAEKLISTFNQIDMSLLDENSHSVWMESHSVLKQQLEQLSKAKNIEKQREILAHLSTQLIETIETFGLNLETVYVSYCPMAFNNNGAYWLSEFKEIRNPYFGDKMLKCGEVKKTITLKSKQRKVNNKKQGEHQH